MHLRRESNADYGSRVQERRNDARFEGHLSYAMHAHTE